MALHISIDDPDRVSFRIRIVCNGTPITALYVDSYEVANELAVAELTLRMYINNKDDIWAAVIESGIRFESFGNEKILFATNKALREGVVLDKALLTTIDRKFLFGLR